MSYTISVYTRPVNKDNYPEGLANSIHISCSENGSEKTPWNKNYGILFVSGEISKNNTIIPMGIKGPCVFYMNDGVIGIAGERIHEDGSSDETTTGKVFLWETTDLISFRACGFIDRSQIEQWSPSESLDVDDETALKASLYWTPATYTKAVIPEGTQIRSAEDLNNIRAELFYSDGSSRTKNIRWDTSGISFDRPGEYTVRGRVTQQSFRFPLAKGYGDPVIFPWDGKWYYISTNDNLNDIGIYVREAQDVDGLFADGVTEHLILPFDPERGFEQTFWAPEFHVIGGELYILFAVSGHQWGPQCHLMKKKKGMPITEESSWEDPVRVIRQNGEPLAKDAITLDMTYVKSRKASYVIWSYRENIGTPLDSGSMLYIASIDENEPRKLTSEPVLLTRPLYGWENVSGTINNEGPNSFTKNGSVYVTYSGGAANGYTYALGLLTASVDADLLDINSWTKSITPVLTFYSVDGEYGPGHNSFYMNDEGEFMISYHAETDIKDNLRCDGIRRVHFRDDGSPYFGMSKEDDLSEEIVETTVSVI